MNASEAYYVFLGDRHGYSWADLARSSTSHEGCSVWQLRRAGMDWPSNWTGYCNRSAFYGFRRATGSPVVSRARGTRRSHLRILFVASPPTRTVRPLNSSTPDKSGYRTSPVPGPKVSDYRVNQDLTGASVVYRGDSPKPLLASLVNLPLSSHFLEKQKAALPAKLSANKAVAN